MRTRWLVLAGAILALNAQALNLLVIRLSGSGRLPGSPTMSRVSGVREYEWILAAPGGVEFSWKLTGYLGACLAPLLGSFAPLRRTRVLRALTPAAFVAISGFAVIRFILAPVEGPTLWKAVAGLVGMAGTLILVVQAVAGVREGTPAATARLLIALILIVEAVGEWSAWGFDPRLLGAWAGIAGGALILVGESRSSRESAVPER